MNNDHLERKNSTSKEISRFYRLPEVETKTGLSKAKIYNLIAQGRFPTQIKLGARASAWIDSEILEWMEARIHFSRNQEAES